MSFVLVTGDPERRVALQEVASDGRPLARVEVAAPDLAPEVVRREAAHPRWVWDDTARWYPALLAAGVRVDRCQDLRLCHAILRGSARSADSALALAPRGPWDGPRAGAPRPVEVSLFDAPREEPSRTDGGPGALAELQAQLAAVEGS
ncbi:MAG TPA: bifunctional 3'-5' exonuclease/DNA polymerase, partial [Cellulomonas sp.]